MSDFNFYELLGIKKNATPSEIRNSFRKLAKTYHPDKYPQDENIFKNISYAYRTLMDSQKREVYDRYGLKGIQGFHGFEDDANDSINKLCGEHTESGGHTIAAFIIILPVPGPKKNGQGRYDKKRGRSQDSRNHMYHGNRKRY